MQFERERKVAEENTQQQESTLTFVNWHMRYFLLILLLYASDFGYGQEKNCPVIFIKFDCEKIVSVWHWMWFDKEIKTKEDILRSLQRYPNFPNRHYFL